MDWWKERYDRPLERSACVACPFQSRSRWVETKRRWPELFAEAVEIDAGLRGGLAFAKEPYLHPCGYPSPRRSGRTRRSLERTGNRTGSATSARVTVASERRGSPLTPPRQSGMIIVIDKLARRCYQHPGPRRHLKEQVMQVVLYYSQTRSRQEAGFFHFREIRAKEAIMAKARAQQQQANGQRAAIYARVSDKSQDGEDKTSLSEQVGEMEAYCEGKRLNITARYQEVEGVVQEAPGVPADAGRRQKRTLRHHRLLEVRPPQQRHVPRRSTHGGRRGRPDTT